jgi:hypothetical protein
MTPTRLRECLAALRWSQRGLIIASGQDRISGDFADVVVALSERTSFDAKAAHRYLTPAQIAECTRSTVVTTLRVKPKLEA